MTSAHAAVEKVIEVDARSGEPSVDVVEIKHCKTAA